MAKQSQAETTSLGAVTGLIAGVVATGPMTVAMILWHRRLPTAVVWGAALGLVTELLKEEARGSGQGPFSSATAPHKDLH